MRGYARIDRLCAGGLDRIIFISIIIKIKFIYYNIFIIEYKKIAIFSHNAADCRGYARMDRLCAGMRGWIGYARVGLDRIIFISIIIKIKFISYIFIIE
jgi:hypothetical protein